MDDKTLQALEWNKIVARLAGLTSFAPGRERAESLAPVTHLDEARRRLAETGEARRLLDRFGEPPLAGLADIRPTLARAARQEMVTPEELAAMARTMTAARRLRRFLEERADDFPLLWGLAAAIGDFRDLEAEIARCVTPEGDLADDASPTLAALRRRERDLHGRVRERLEAMVRSPSVRPHLQEPLVTLRQERYVLPVKQEHRGQVPGIVHDQSASGATLFIEPMAVVEMNNELRRLALEIAREEEAVLRRLGALVAERGEALAATAEALAGLDLALAKGRLSREMDAAAPELNDTAVIDLRRARHPLLRGRVVPVDVRLGEEFDTLVITGPNTGGKTVTLKTVGLLTLMAQAGLHVPAASGSRLAVFRQVFVDVGDEQSIEQNLSTFSSHLRNIVAVTRSAGPDTLVLLDELGAGTDPAEGAALAMALLEHLQAAGARTIATTHYSELKTFAYTRHRVENASVEFDAETLAPTYRLVIGLPGRSNAFEIAARLGLDGAIVGRAREIAGRRHREVEALIAGLEKDRRALARERDLAVRDRAEAARLREEVERRAEALRAKGEEALGAARREARAVVEAARREAAEAVRRLREAAAEAEAGRLPAREALARAEGARQRLHQAGRWVAEAGEGFARLLREAAPPREAAPLVAARPGQTVLVRSLGLSGQVVETGHGGQVTVQVGAMKVTVPLADLAAAEPAPPAASRPHLSPPSPRLPHLTAEKALTAATEIHLRRLTVGEALERLDKFLDDAVLAGLGQVRIVHGKGTGTLRQAVADYLRRHPLVEDFRLGGPDEGGAGVTIALLRL